MKRKSETVSFRIPIDLLKLLDKEREAFSISRGDFARAALINRLTFAEDEARKVATDNVMATLEAVQSEVRLIERRMARLLFVLLTKTADISADEAREITQEQFLRHK